MNVPFTEVLDQAPADAKFPNEILSKKRILYEHEIIAMTAITSAVIQNMTHKLKDPGSFSILVPIRHK